MKLVLLSNLEFKLFADNHPLISFYQTLEYALFMKEIGYEYDLIGLKDNYDNVICASIIFFNHIDNKRLFGYAPKGFLIDYKDTQLVNIFTNYLKEYYKKKNVIFIKLNPNINISKYDKEHDRYIYNENAQIIPSLNKIKYQELKRSKYFEALIPNYSPVVNLREFAYKNLEKNVRNKIRKCYRKGLFIEKATYENIKDIYPFIKNKTKKNLKYYQKLYLALIRNKMVDVFLIKVNFEEFLINTKDKYQRELQNNNLLSKAITIYTSEKLLKRKLQSDKELEVLKNDIIVATNGLSKSKIKIIAGAITIKYKNKVTIFASGYNYRYKKLNSYDFMYYKLLEYYKYSYDYLDLDGYSGDLSNDNPYKGLNDFKRGFNPEIYESIGEYDIVINKFIYNRYAGNKVLTNISNNIKY